MALAEKSRMTIGAAAKQAGLGVETIRFYERKGLITQPPKVSGFRYYSETDIKVLIFIRKAKTLGFSLDAIKELLELEVCSEETSKVIRAKSQEKVREIKQKISELEDILKTLEKFQETCASGEKTSTKCCGLLDCFERDWECC